MTREKFIAVINPAVTEGARRRLKLRFKFSYLTTTYTGHFYTKHS